ncbi:unnamed protein product [Owenia fusiformis]|uniref:Uncharacterized protein n=1 Tax=Owenia fusiformis TaxID=6347 RepID=A0A8J1U4M3_OWEFU|nr:unnamed protein product [Owenia fusiformis]
MDPIVGLFGEMEDDTKILPEILPPEIEEGNVEYKLKLVNPSDDRFEHLVTQMKWRLQEGQGEAIYEIGVADNGMLAGLTDDEMSASLNTLQQMASRLGATTSMLRERVVETAHAESRKRAAEILVRKVPDDQQFIDLRLAVLGNVDTGKSTLLGVLTQGELDNGRGRARLNLFRHLHEIQSGRTSSISHEILGFNSNGEVVNYSESRTAEAICENSTKLITLIDLAGHHKYLKTTIFGLTGYSPDFAMLVVSAATGIVGTTREHLGLALALEVPIFVVISKVDICSQRVVKRTLEQLERLLKSPGSKKVPMRVESEDDAIMAASTISSESIAPIFTVSNVTGKHLDLLTKFLNVLPPLRSHKDREGHLQQPAIHQVEEVYCVPDVGTVLGGTLIRGSIKEGEKMLVGPMDTGEFQEVIIQGLHRSRRPCRMVRAGEACSVSLGSHDKSTLRKGMVLVSPKLNPQACTSFEAEIYLLFHANSIGRGFQCTLHIGSVCQTAIIDGIIQKDSIQTGEKAVVIFRFIKQPEYIRLGSRLLFREGPTKGMGQITKVMPMEQNPFLRAVSKNRKRKLQQ